MRNNQIDCFFDCASFIEGSINIVNGDGSREFTSGDVVELNELFVDEETRSSAIDQRIDVDRVMGVESFKIDIHENRVSFVRGKGLASILKIRVFGKNGGEFPFFGRERSSERTLIFVVYLFTLQG